MKIKFEGLHKDLLQILFQAIPCREREQLICLIRELKGQLNQQQEEMTDGEISEGTNSLSESSSTASCQHMDRGFERKPALLDM